MTVTVTRDNAGGTRTLTTSVDATTLRISAHMSREAILSDIDNLKFSKGDEYPGSPQPVWNGTCSPVNLTPGLADVRAYVAALPARSGT